MGALLFQEGEEEYLVVRLPVGLDGREVETLDDGKLLLWRRHLGETSHTPEGLPEQHRHTPAHFPFAVHAGNPSLRLVDELGEERGT
jgi:hypothetical protein